MHKPELIKTQEKIVCVTSVSLTFDDTTKEGETLMHFTIDTIEAYIKGQKFFYGSVIFRFFTFVNFLYESWINEYNLICTKYYLPVQPIIKTETYSPFKMCFIINKIQYILCDNKLLKCSSNLKKGYKAFGNLENPDDIKDAYYNMLRSMPKGHKNLVMFELNNINYELSRPTEYLSKRKIYELIKSCDEAPESMPKIENFINMVLIKMKMTADSLSLIISGIDHNVLDWRKMEGSFSLVKSEFNDSKFMIKQRSSFFGKCIEEDISQIPTKCHYTLDFKCNSSKFYIQNSDTLEHLPLIISMFLNFDFKNKENDNYLNCSPNPYDQLQGISNFFYQMHGKLNVCLNNFIIYVISKGIPTIEITSTQTRIKQDLYSYIFVMEKLKGLKIVEKDLKLPVFYFPRVNPLSRLKQ